MPINPVSVPATFISSEPPKNQVTEVNVMNSPNTLPGRRMPLLFPRLAIVLTTAFLVAAAGCSVPPEPNTVNDSKEPSEAAGFGQ